MKKLPLGFHILYYPLIVIAFLCFQFLSSRLYRLLGGPENIGTALLFIYATVFFAIPILIAVLMRFSLLPWYVDPFAAALVPSYLYFGMVLKRSAAGETVTDSFAYIHNTLSSADGMGWFFLAGLFFFGLIASFSFDRKERNSISYRLLSKHFPE